MRIEKGCSWKHIIITLWFLCLLFTEAQIGKAATGVARVSLGADSGAVIKDDGSLWCWGWNVFGQIGNGTTIDQITPIKILDDVTAVSLGEFHTAAIKKDGTLWCWGDNMSGQLGNGTTTDSYIPVKIMSGVKAISVNSEHSAAIKDDGSLWCWGYNISGQLGNGTTQSSSIPLHIMDNVKEISTGINHCAAIKDDGTLWCWGNNQYGQLGNGSTENSYVPVKIMDNVKSVSLGEFHSAAIRNDGSLWVWGRNEYGQLGDGTTNDYCIPIKIMEDVEIISCKVAHSAVIKKDGSLWCWGVNACGQVGNGTLEDSNIPVKILSDVRSVSLGFYHSAAIKTDGSLWSWGVNDKGQLGNGTTKDSLTPVLAIAAIYEIAYDANGGIGSPSKVFKETGKDITLSSVVPVRNDYQFLGWAESATATTAEYQPGSIYAEDKDNTLFAVWKDNNYTVTYDANGGNNAPASQNQRIGTSVQISKNKPVREGHTFLGWAGSATATTADYQPEDNYIKNQDITLFAIWKINTYTVTYDANGGNDAPAIQIKTYGIDLNLSKTMPTRAGYIFSGWAETRNAERASYQAAEIYNIDKNVTLYAVWKIKTYKVEYHVNGGSGTIADQIKKHGEALILCNEKPTREGYVFLGWATSPESTTINYQSAGKYTLEDNIILYAVWEKEKIIAQKQTITVKSNITKEYKKNSKFKLGASAKTKLTYRSTNKKVVTVSKKGIVTIKGYGSAKIKITAAATEYYEKAGKTVKISIVPKKMTGLKADSPEKGVLTIRWKKNKQMNGYEIQFSTSKKFVMGKTKIGKASVNTTSTSVTGLKSGKTYYVRIRGYRMSNGVQVDGLWTSVKKVKIR